MLSAHLTDHDTVGQWMAHHLAELVAAAQDDATTTMEQRQQIVDTILKVWTHRRYHPGRAPLEEFSNVFAALDRLGDGSPWKFSRLFNEDTKVPDPNRSGLPLLVAAAELEQLTRETLLRLIWLAVQDAKEKNQEWLEAGDKVASNLESEVTETLRRLLRHHVTHRRLRTEHRDPSDIAETAADAPSGDGNSDGKTEDEAERATTNAAVESDVKDVGGDLFDDEHEDEGDPLSDISHVKRLRDMANLLNKVADALAVPNPRIEK